MISIAIIDDGINDKCFQIDNIIEHIIIDNTTIIRNASTNADKYSHGSICAAILSKSTNVFNIISIGMKYDEAIGGYNITSFITALKLCLSLDIDLLHLSLGVMDYSYYYDILKVINAIHDKGVLIIAAYNMTERITIPACFSNVLGVMHSPYIKNTLPFKFIDYSICGADVIVNVKEIIRLKDGTVSCFDKASSYAVPLICSEIAKKPSKIEQLHELKAKSGVKFEKSIDWIANPLILVFAEEKIDILDELIIFHNYTVINAFNLNFERDFTKFINDFKDINDIIIFDDKNVAINILTNNTEICDFIFQRNLALFVEDNSFVEYVLKHLKGRIFSSTEICKKTLIQNKANSDIQISWEIYKKENEIKDILLNSSNTLYVSYEKKHILYGIEYIPEVIRKSKKSFKKYVANLAYIHNLSKVCVIKKQ